MLEHDLTTYEDDTIVTYVSFPIHQLYTVGSMLFCEITGAPHSCIGNEALERTVRHYGRRSIPIIYSKHDFKFDDRLI